MILTIILKIITRIMRIKRRIIITMTVMMMINNSSNEINNLFLKIK